MVNTSNLDLSSTSNTALIDNQTSSTSTYVQQNAYDLSLSNSIPTSSANGNLQVITPNADIVQNRMVFSTVSQQARLPKTLTIRNTSTQAVTVTGLNFGDDLLDQVNAVRPEDYQRGADFKLANAVALPLTLQPGQSQDLSIAFTPQRVPIISNTVTYILNGENYASLNITSQNAGDSTTKVNTVELAGLDSHNFEGGNEPALAQIVRTFGWTTDLGTVHDFSNERKLYGDEVSSRFWQSADPTSPVQLFPIASFKGRSSFPSARAGFLAKPGSGGNSGTLYAFAGQNNDDNIPGSNNDSGGENQKLLPKIFVNGVNTSPTASLVSFRPTTAFSLVVDGSSTNYTINGPDQTYNYRIFPMRDAQGTLIPDTWIVGQDYGTVLQGKNFDSQDEVYVLKNARPESLNLDPSIGGLFTTSPKLVNNFNNLNTESYYPANSLKDKDGETIGFTSTQLNKNDTLTTNPSYNPRNIDIDKTTGKLKITTTAGSNAGNDNTLVNGLQTTFDGRVNKFNISTKLVGPLNNLAQPVQQGGLMFGPNQDNFIKLVAIARGNGSVGVQLYSENRGVGSTIGNIATIANPATVQSLELRLVADPQAGTIRAEYQAAYAGNTVTGTVGSLQLQGGQLGHYFAAQSKAGILALSKFTTPTTVTFDSFAITSGETKASREGIYRLDVGGSSNYTDSIGRTWTPDTGYFTPSNAPIDIGGRDPNTPAPAISNTTDDKLYQTYRALLPGNPPLQNRILTYNLPVASGKVDLRLQFAELYFGVADGSTSGVGKRSFDIIVEGKTMLRNFDISAAAGGGLTALIVPIEGVQVNDGMLTIQFKADKNFGSIAAIGVYKSPAS